MSSFMQIIFINLAVSCDNIGVIALSTKDLPPKKAAQARYIGIGLSLVLKLVFMGLIGALLSMPWLHIHIVGGALLLYVTFGMLHQHESNQPAFPNGKERHDTFLTSIIAIIAADVSMSLDNVIAIMGVVSSDGQVLSGPDYLLVLAGLLVCVPILLFCSKTVAKLLERFPVLTYLCAAYLTYTSVKMIFEDDVISYFCKQANFNFMTAAAVICGELVFVYGLLSSKSKLPISKLKHGAIFLLYCAVIVYSLVLVGTISYLWTNPNVGSDTSRVLDLLRFQPSGANAVYQIWMARNLFGICAIIYAGTIYERRKGMSFLSLFLTNAKAMVIFVLLEMIIGTAGLSYIFGFGAINPLMYLVLFAAQTMPLLVYSAVFSMFSVLARNKVLLILSGLLYIYLEHLLASICIVVANLRFFAGFFPSYYLSTFLANRMEPIWFIRIFIITALYIIVAVWLGNAHHKKKI